VGNFDEYPWGSSVSGINPEHMKNAWTLPPIDWSMHHPDEDDEFNPPCVMPAFPPYSYAASAAHLRMERTRS
jgi:hypothetical protein